METVKLNNDVMETSPSAGGFFYRRIGGTLFKVRVFTVRDMPIRWMKKFPG